MHVIERKFFGTDRLTDRPTDRQTDKLSYGSSFLEHKEQFDEKKTLLRSYRKEKEKEYA